MLFPWVHHRVAVEVAALQRHWILVWIQVLDLIIAVLRSIANVVLVCNCSFFFFFFLNQTIISICIFTNDTLINWLITESGIIADISIVSDDGGDGTERSHWNSTLESPTYHLPTTSTPLQSPTSATATATVTSASSSDTNLTPYDQDMSINL